MHELQIEFKTEKSGREIFIDGFANAATEDRGNELIEPKGWILENYKKNPVVLFDHGLDPYFGALPVGKAVIVEPNEKGLFAKIKISNSDNDRISALRDLVEEGILKTFSVGFKPGQIEKEGNLRKIKSAELLEISIVPIPMNQDSTFSISTKNLNRHAKKWIDSFFGKNFELELEEFRKKINYNKIELLKIEVGKSGFDSIEKAKTFLKNRGYSVDNYFETDKLYIFNQSILNDFDVDNNYIKKINIDPYSIITVGARKMENTDISKEKDKENMEEEKACSKDKEKKKELSPEMVAAMDQYHSEAMSCANDEEGNPAAWVADEEAWKKAKEAADQSYDRSDPEKYYAVVTWLYLNKFGGTIKKSESIDSETAEKSMDVESIKMENQVSAPIPTGSNAINTETNPLLDLSKQQIILLGTMISELQMLNKNFENYFAPKEEETQIPPEEVNEFEKSISAIRLNQEILHKRLSKFI